MSSPDGPTRHTRDRGYRQTVPPNDAGNEDGQDRAAYVNMPRTYRPWDPYNECGVRSLPPCRPSPGRTVRDRPPPRTVPHVGPRIAWRECMSINRVGHRHGDRYDLFPVAVTLLTMSAVADREARARRELAELTRKMGKLNVNVEETQITAAVLRETSARVAACAHRLRDMAVRLTGLTGFRAGSALERQSDPPR